MNRTIKDHIENIRKLSPLIENETKGIVSQEYLNLLDTMIAHSNTIENSRLQANSPQTSETD